MSQGDFDHLPGIARLSAIGQQIDDTETSIADTIKGQLLDWMDAGMFGMRDRNQTERAELARVAARAALAVMLAHPLVALPDHIEQYAHIPGGPVEDLIAAIHAVCPEIAKAAEPEEAALAHVARTIGAALARRDAA